MAIALDQSVNFSLTADASGLSSALNSAEKDMLDLESVSKRIRLLENAVASVDQFKAGVAAAQAKVKNLQETLSEAYASGADAPALKRLESQLSAAEKAAVKAEAALLKSTAAVVKLDLDAGRAGITTGNLAKKKAELAAEAQKVGVKIEGLSKQLNEAVTAENLLLAKTNSLNGAFGTLNIRSADQINADILAINQALIKLASSTNLSGAEFDRAFIAGQAEIKRLRAELNNASGDVSKIASRADGLIGSMGKLGLAFSGAALAQQFVTVNIELENIERTFKALTGSSAAAAQELEYVRGVADKLGIEGISAAKAFAQLLAATKGTTVEGQATRDVFQAVAQSMSIAGKTSADTEGALQALAQMASKGTVSMEELRGQLGERLPGALKATADGFGITTAQLIKLVESGRLTASELFPALAIGLKKLYGDSAKAGEGTDTLAQSIAKFKNNVNDLYKSIGDSGIIHGMSDALKGLGAALIVASNGLVTTGKTIGTFFAALANGDIGIRGFSDTAKAAFAEIAKEAEDKLIKAGMSNEVLAASLTKSQQAAIAAQQAQTAAAAAAEQSGTAASGAATNWTSLNVAYGDLDEKIQAAVKQSEALAEAKKAEAATSVALANAFGTEAEKLAAQSAAAATNAAASAAVAERKKELYAVVQANIEALTEEAAANGGLNEQQQKTIDALQKTAEARQADADKAIAQADAMRLAAAQADAANQAYADNSSRLGELKTAYDAATAAVAALRVGQAAGKDVTAQLSAAEMEAAKSAYLYRDAIKDQIDKIDALKNAQLGANNVEQAGIRLQIERLRGSQSLLRAQGDEVSAARAGIEIKQLEIKMAQLVAQAKQAEANAARLLALAKIEEIRASGNLTDAKRAEIAALEAGVRVKEIEAQIAGVTAESLRDLMNATQGAGAAAAGSAGGYEQMAGSMNAAADAANRLNAAQDVTRKMDSSSILDDKDVRGRQGPVDVEAIAYKQGATAEEAKAAAKYYGELYQRESATRLTGNLGNGDNAAQEMNLASKSAMEKAIEYARSELATGQAVDLGTSVNDLVKKNIATTNWENQLTPAGGEAALRAAYKNAGNEAKSQPATVNITIGNKTQKVNVASNNDAANLATILRQLESDAARSSL